VSHVLQWNINAPDFSASSNSFWLNVTVWSWSFGQTISKSMRSLMSLLLPGHSSNNCSNKFCQSLIVAHTASYIFANCFRPGISETTIFSLPNPWDPPHR
jgi:hypothetical protein